jgi:hypothetical protein
MSTPETPISGVYAFGDFDRPRYAVRRTATAVALLLASCSASPSATPSTGTPRTEPEVLAMSEERLDFSQTPATTTTTAPPPTTTAPTTTTTEAVVVPMTAAPAVTHSSGRLGDPYYEPTWHTLRECEAPDWAGGWQANTGNGYYGGLQFALGSWRAVGGSGYPHQASVAEQIRRGQMLWEMQGWGAWPACSRKLGWR